MHEFDPSTLLGTTVDRYQLEELIGSGGFGAVFRARHLVLEQEFALKLLHPTRAARKDIAQRFLQEAKAAAGIGSPNIVQVTDAGVTAEGAHFLVMELLEGRGLDALILQEAPLATPRALRLAIQILTGLQAAHERNIIHRDLKPANVFVTRDEYAEELAKILDFGISRIWSPEGDSGLTQSGMIMGTPQFMAPEQFRDPRVDARADVYAASVILYQMLSATLPFSGKRYDEVLLAIHQTQPKPLSALRADIPKELSDIIGRGLSRDPDGRWPTAASLRQALDGGLAGTPVDVATTQSFPKSKNPATPTTPAELGVAVTLASTPPPTADGDQAAASEQDTANTNPVGPSLARRRRVHVVAIGTATVVLLGVFGGMYFFHNRASPVSTPDIYHPPPVPGVSAKDARARIPSPTASEEPERGQAENALAHDEAEAISKTDTPAPQARQVERSNADGLRREPRRQNPPATQGNQPPSMDNADLTASLHRAQTSLAGGNHREAFRHAQQALMHGGGQRAQALMTKARCGLRELGPAVALSRGLTGASLRDAKRFCSRHGIQL